MPNPTFRLPSNETLSYWNAGRLLGYGGWKAGSKVVMRDNLYWRAGGEPIDFVGKTFEQWQAEGNDDGSMIADPMFLNPDQRDFRLHPDSAASKIGFIPFDFAQAGVYGDPHWIELATSTLFPDPYVVPEPGK